VKRPVSACLVVLVMLLALTKPASALTLGEGLAIVIEDGYDVRIAGERERAGDAGAREARGALMPTLDAYASSTWLAWQPESSPLPDMTIPLSEKDYYSFGVTGKYVLYDFGHARGAYRAALFGADAASLDASAARNAAAREFIVAYIDYLEAGRLVTVTESEALTFEAHKADMDALFAEGLATKNDVLEAEVAQAEARLRVLAATDARAVRAAALNTLLRRPIATPVEIVDPEIPRPSLPELAEAERAAIEARPELRAFDARLDAREQELGAARASLLPSLYAAGGYEYKENRYMVHEDNWSLTLGATVNLFAGGASAASIAKKAAEVSALAYERDRQRDAVLLALRAAWLDVGSGGERVNVARVALDRAEENVRVHRIRLEEGDETPTGLRDALSLLSRAETSYWSSLFALYRTEALYLHASGRDLAEVYGR
jgi:outer membrane protein TolC